MILLTDDAGQAYRLQSDVKSVAELVYLNIYSQRHPGSGYGHPFIRCYRQGLATAARGPMVG